MPLAGKGMLVTSMDIDPSDEQDFNRWYDREHIAERVAIEGFLEARRYIAHDAGVKYLSLYSTLTFEVLDSPAYRQALAHQTEWSRKTIAKFRNMGRVIGRITASQGHGRGAALAFVRVRPSAGDRGAMRGAIRDRLDPAAHDGVVSMHLIESDPELSKSLTQPDAPNPGAGDWYILIDGTDPAAVRAAAEGGLGPREVQGATIVSTDTYRLMWDIAKSDLER